MNKIVFFFIPALLFAISPFESPESSSFELSAYETKKSAANIQAANNPKIKCRLVCDKKIYKEQKISDAIEFYKNSKEYRFK
ncbi:hypothetical protein [Sulfurimonas sp.]|uniref:hypothetical protein n=1 Tax=Sulfurimonas sp. TaxID=2022749 RepID=UPI0035659BFF